VLIEGVFAREARRIAQAISAAESGNVSDLLRGIYPRTGRARVLGLTGPPGAGKSTLALRVAQVFRRRGQTVGIVAVDPSSPFTGGAILGDRIRMGEIYTDPGVFIRSMATRGAMGGLARATSDAVDILDAAGFDVVLVETVGVGQDEVDIVKTAETVAVVLVPGLGDDIQAIKAGILEIADVFVVNKADREGADRTAAELAMMLDLAPSRSWRPPIVRTVAPRGEGVEAVIDAMESHGRSLHASPEGGLRSARRARSRLLALLEERFHRTIESRSPEPDGFEDAVERVCRRIEDPYSAAGRLFERLVREPAVERA
jgi:LAO/AO transport system kinase